MSQTNGNPGAVVRVLSARGGGGIRLSRVPPAARRHSEEGARSLPEAIEEALGEKLKSTMSFVVPALHAQLESRWRYAAKTYRAAHPGTLPVSKAYRNLLYKRLLPREDAEAKMITWIPYAISQIQAGFVQLAPQFAQLNADQVNAVDAEPEDSGSDDE
jgi:hypothetical protein